MAFLINGTTVIDNSRNANNLGYVQQTTGQPFWVNPANVYTSFTIATNLNAASFGPITIDSGVNVTVSSGSVWTII